MYPLTDYGKDFRAPDGHSELESPGSESPNNRQSSGWTISDPASVEERGRTFSTYREGAYFLPNDALEQNRLDLEHEMWKLTLDGALSMVPFEKTPESVLDIGTGTGIWAIEFAQEYPESYVVGTDISLIQPLHDCIPPNCSFERDDIEDGWIFDRSFDYIHLRGMLTCFNDHKAVLQKMFDNVCPGGWVEYQDFLPQGLGKDAANEEAYHGSPMQIFTQRTVEAAARFGRDMMIASKYKQLYVLLCWPAGGLERG
jgi:ubiquinone/menaquinone biosynthesis C-methylase UbiE